MAIRALFRTNTSERTKKIHINRKKNDRILERIASELLKEVDLK